MPKPVLKNRQTPGITAIQTIQMLLHPLTIISLWLPGYWFMHELLSVMSLVETDLVSSLERFQASLFITR